MLNVALVFCGGGLGASMRYGILRLAALLGWDQAWAVLLVNLIGSFALGFLLGALWSKFDLSEEWRLFLMTGVISGFTTFATFSADITRLVERSMSISLLYLVVSVSGGVLLLVIGMKLGRG